MIWRTPQQLSLATGKLCRCVRLLPQSLNVVVNSQREYHANRSTLTAGVSATPNPTPPSSVDPTPSPHPTHNPNTNPTYQRARARRQRSHTPFDVVAASDTAPTVPGVYPGAQLPPLPQTSAGKRSKFSFFNPSAHIERDYHVHDFVPNSLPKPKLPMWASSLTSPTLGKQRLVVDSWVCVDAGGWVDEAKVRTFVEWLENTVLPEEHPLLSQVRENIIIRPRKTLRRGVFAARSFTRGETILSVPLQLARGSQSSLGALALNSESLGRHSTTIRRYAAIPSYELIRDTISVRKSDFDPIPHPLFIDQLHAALHLACEKAAGEASLWYPYLQLLGGEPPVDDEYVKELHRPVLDSMSFMEYDDHKNRWAHHLRQLRTLWEAEYAKEQATTRSLREVVGMSTGGQAGEMRRHGERHPRLPSGPIPERNLLDWAPSAEGHGVTESLHVTAESAVTAASVTREASSCLLPPPTLEDMMWAFRVVISRQRILPGLRQDTARFLCDCTEEGKNAKDLDLFARTVLSLKWDFYENMLGAIDADRLKVNDFNPRDICTIVPLVDFLSYPPGGIANTSNALEMLPTTATDGGGTEEGSTTHRLHMVVRATEAIAELDELTTLYPKCYSVAYTLYKYGCLPLRRREDDVRQLLELNGLDGCRRPMETVWQRTKALWGSSFAQCRTALLR